MLTYFLLIFIVLMMLYLYQRYKSKIDRETTTYNYNIIQEYLLTETEDTRLEKTSKPIIWIFIDYEYNSRKWESFGSRSSYRLNQPYLYLTVKTIIERCNNSFHICLIDEQSFTKLLPNWGIDMSRISNPLKQYMIDLGMTKLLYRYGGIRVPVSFICMRDLIGLYDNAMVPFIGEFVNRNITSSHYDFYPSIEFMGAYKENHIIGELVEFMQREISRDYTDETKIVGSFNRWCNYRVEKHQMILLVGEMIGTKTIEKQQILIDHLLTADYIDINKNTYGIYIPEKELLNRNHYNWFVRMSPEQILQGNMIISKYLLLSNIPDAPMGVIEPMYQRKPNWVNFWKIPSAAPMWGLKPILLGNDVPSQKYPENIPGPN